MALRAMFALLVLLVLPLAAQPRNRFTMAAQFPFGSMTEFGVWEGEHARVQAFDEKWTGYLWPTLFDEETVEVTITDGRDRNSNVLEVVTLSVGDDFVHTGLPVRLRVVKLSRE